MVIEEVDTQLYRKIALKGVEAFGDQNLVKGEIWYDLDTCQQQQITNSL